MEKIRLFFFAQIAVLVLFLGGAAVRGSDGPMITELFAGGSGVLLDEDSEYSDWIEIFNPGDQAVDLTGWFLTDAKDKLMKWQFPGVSLPAKRFLVVFASGKNRFDPAAPLHTSFKLGEGGSFLALVRDDGVTIASQYTPKYPAQVSGASYGHTMTSTGLTVLGQGAGARLFVPADAGLGLTWTAEEFDDSAWTSGPTGIGYDAKATPTYKDLIATDIQALLQNVNTSVYIRIPFTVEDPAILSSLTLRMKYEDGFAAYLNGKEVARRNAPTTLAWNSRAPARRAEKDALVYEEVDISRSLDLLKSGSNLLAIHGLNENKTGTAFLMLPEVAGSRVDQVDPSSPLYFSVQTPGLPNGAGLPGVAEGPRFSQPGGAYAENISLELSVTSPSAAIHYTLDQKEPTEASPTYSAPIVIAKTTVVRARTFEPGLLPSPTSTKVYTALDPTLKDFSSNLPVIIINTFGRSIPEDPKVPSYLSIYNVYEGRSSFRNPSDLETQIGIKLRGSSSLGFDKKNYSVETWDGNGKDRQLSLFGFPQDSDWILYGPYTDKTLMRDVLAYDWSNEIGRWAPGCQFIEAFLSTSVAKLRTADSIGVYVAMEKIKWGKDRVDVQRLYRSQGTEPEVSGGYILKKDRLDPGDVGFTTSQGQLLAYVYPKEHQDPPMVNLVITSTQKIWIKKYIDTFEGALYGNNFKDPVNGYAKYIDVDSFIDHHILVELTKNIDGYRLSTFMFKDREGKLNMGPIWDYNLTLGNANYLNGWLANGWYYPQLSTADYPWYPRLFQDPAFVARYQQRWFMFRQDQFATQKLIDRIDAYAALLAEAQVRNYNRWKILGIYVWPNWYIGKTYEEEVEWMKGWLRDRVAWIDSQFLTAPVFSQKGGQVPSGFELTITAKNGSIFYTTDKSDPRLADESPSPTAQEYTGPIAITANTRVRARTKIGNAWSALTEATFITAYAPITVTEIMYLPEAPAPGGSYVADDFEFLELQNTGDEELDLNGFQITDTVRFVFTGSQVTKLPPKGHVVLVRKLAAFSARYSTEGMSIAGQYTGSLSNLRGTIGLKGSLDEQIFRFSYDASWQPSTNGGGRSLVIVDPAIPRENLGKAESWRASSKAGGSPGLDDPPPQLPGLQVPGDITQDGKLGLFDAILLVRAIYLSGVQLPCEGALESPGNVKLLDLNGDGSVDSSDTVYLLSHLFQSGPPPVLGTACTEMEGCPRLCTQ